MITKIDLAEVCEFDRETALANIQSVRPGMPVFETSAKTGVGMEEWIEFLYQTRRQLLTTAESAK